MKNFCFFFFFCGYASACVGICFFCYFPNIMQYAYAASNYLAPNYISLSNCLTLETCCKTWWWLTLLYRWKWCAIGTQLLMNLMIVIDKSNYNKFMSTCIRRWRQHKWEEGYVQVPGQSNQYKIVLWLNKIIHICNGHPWSYISLPPKGLCFDYLFFKF